VVTLNKSGGTAVLIKATQIIEEQIKARGGIFKIVSHVTRIGARDRDENTNEDLVNKYT